MEPKQSATVSFYNKGWGFQRKRGQQLLHKHETSVI